ncbi:hypothetical protein B7494_g5854 [Chlorociboria aeruginascens]|nr:hypothetical protein B7494_g5854 [Chlorociboria aeruginascens]
MEAEEREFMTEQLNALRRELKLWEKDFSAKNEGRKASRDDIKKHPDIALKYKEYNKTRDILSGKIPHQPSLPPRHTPRKRKHEEEQTQQLPKRFQTMKTPSKISMNPWEVDPYHSPSAVRNLFTPVKKTAIGPTPQKDGLVLGIFDLLQEDNSQKAPSKEGGLEGNATDISVGATPRKSGSIAGKHSKTPASSGKRHMLDSFMTPLKNRNANGQAGTPSSVSKLNFSTPSFLRRDNQRAQMPTVNENEDGIALSPQMVRLPKKPLVRGLSSMLAGLRKMEEDAADDDLEALREMENEEAGEYKSPTKKTPRSPPEASILIEDSQNLPLGGFDSEAKYDSDPPETELGRDGQPLKVYKKKGQKRTTRRVKMKPIRSKPPAPAQAQESDDELAESNEAVVVPETQVDEKVGFADARNFDSDSQSEYTASEGGTRYRRPDQSKKVKRIGKDGRIKSVAKKVGAVAHQNFKRLKLKNSGARGGLAHNSRFRRRK